MMCWFDDSISSLCDQMIHLPSVNNWAEELNLYDIFDQRNLNPTTSRQP